MLTSTNAELLKVLDEDAGLLTGEVSHRAQVTYCSFNKRQRSGAVRSWLVNMMKDGLVEFLDDKKPVAWKRTAAGTAALKEFERRST